MKHLLKICNKFFAFKSITKNLIKTYSLSASENLKLFRMNAPKHRENPIVTKLDTPEFKAIFSPELEFLVDLFEKNGFEIRIAGGAVRDLLMGITPKDIDFATNATPDQMKELFTKEEIRMINTKGEKHGTITPRINDKENFEVTTLRIDVVTDGRRAEVQFTQDWLLDANRRDLTINSMFLGLDGSVYDYFYGYEDLEKRRIAFVGNADTRIKEDYLRILRYFRFYGRIALQPDNHEDATLRSINENIAGLERISGERIWSELKKILEGNFAGELMNTMLHVGLSKYIGLPEKPNVSEFNAVWSRSSKNKLHPITLISALLKNLDEANNLYSRLKYSSYERDLALFVIEHRVDKQHVKPLLPYQQLILGYKSRLSDTREWVLEVLKYRNDISLLRQLEAWEVPKFPVNGNMLKQFGLTNGRLIGAVMNQLRVHWAEHDFEFDADKLMEQVPIIVDDLEQKKEKKKNNYNTQV